MNTLGIDLGTSEVKVLLLAANAEVVSLLNIRGGSDRALPTFSFPA
jgi:sugar (pentulose or hexulose) kinase